MRPLRQQIREIDPSPPEWVLRLVQTQDRTIPWWDMVRSALSVGPPLVLGLGLGNLGLGLLMGLGTIPAMLADRGGPLILRVRRASAGILMGIVGLVVGNMLGTIGWPAILIVAALAILSGLGSNFGANASFASLQLLVYLAIGSGLRVPLAPWELALFFIIGGGWSVLLSTAQALIEGLRYPEAEAVANVLRATADLLRAIDTPDMEDRRRKLTNALNTAYDSVLKARSLAHARDPRLAWLGEMLNAETGLIEASVALAHAGIAPPLPDIGVITALAMSVESHEDPPALSFADTTSSPPQLRALHREMEALVDRFGRPATRSTPSRGERFERAKGVWEAVLSSWASWEYAIRLGICLAVAEAVREVIPIERPYWIVLTVAIVVKPDFGSVFARAVQRGAGTLVGVVIGGVLLAEVPVGLPIVLVITVIAGLLPLAMRRNYGLLATFITPLAMMLVELGGHAGADVLGARLLATLIGCGIVLVLGYVLWPGTWRARVGQRVGPSLKKLAEYLDAAMSRDESRSRRLRRQVYRDLSDTRGELQRMLSEPPPFSRYASAWWPVVIQLERVADSIAEAFVRARQGGYAPSEGDVEVLRRALDEMGDALISGKELSKVELPEDTSLKGVAHEIATVRRLMGQAPDRIVSSVTRLEFRHT